MRKFGSNPISDEAWRDSIRFEWVYKTKPSADDIQPCARDHGRAAWAAPGMGATQDATHRIEEGSIRSSSAVARKKPCFSLTFLKLTSVAKIGSGGNQTFSSRNFKLAYG